MQNGENAQTEMHGDYAIIAKSIRFRHLRLMTVKSEDIVAIR